MTTTVTVSVTGATRRAEVKVDGQATVHVADGETKTVVVENGNHARVEDKIV